MTLKLDDKLSEDLHRIFLEDKRVSFAIVFGSMARGECRKESDLDIAIELLDGVEEAPIDVRLELLAEISSLPMTVDLVLIEDATPALAYRIASDGIVVFAISKKAVTRFKARAYTMYPEWRRLMEPHKKAMLARIEDGTYG